MYLSRTSGFGAIFLPLYHLHCLILMPFHFSSLSPKQVGVQTMIEPNAGATALEDKVNAAHPILVGSEEDGDNERDQDE